MMKKMIIVLIILALPTVASAFEVNFSVTERAGVARSQRHVHHAIPLARSAGLCSTDSFRILDHYAEFTVLSRYGGPPGDASKPIRMVLVDFEDSLAANQTATYTFTSNGTDPPQSEPLLVTETQGYLEVNTGPAVFRISKTTGNLFDYVAVEGTVLVEHPKSSGMRVDVDGIDYASYNSAPAIEIFHNGPMYASIVVRGNLVDKKGTLLTPQTPPGSKVPDSHVQYAFYYTFYKDASHVLVQQTLKNNGRGWSRYYTSNIENLYIDSWSSSLEYTAAGATRIASFYDYSQGYTSSVYRLRQNELNADGFEKQSYDFQAKLSKDGTVVKTFGKYNGYAAIGDSKGSIMVADKWFWQNYPGEFVVSGDELTYNFLPTRPADYPGLRAPAGYVAKDATDRYLDTGSKYRILGGMWKTHRTIYSFSAADPNYEEEVADLQYPLIITLDPNYVGNTNFFCFQFASDFTSDYTFPAGEKLQDDIDRWRDFAASIWEPKYDNTYGRSFPTLREERNVPLWQWTKSADGSIARTYASWYGWERFGGSPRAWNFGFNSQHYDFSYQAYLVSQREQNYAVYRMYEELVDNLADVLTLHDPNADVSTSAKDDKYLNGSQRYELDALVDNHRDHTHPIQDPFYGNAHVWTKGVFVYYLLTGEPRFAEIAKMYLYHANMSKDLGAAKGETRDLTRLMGAAINYWQVFGDRSALDISWAIWQRLEAAGSMVRTDMFALDCRISSDKLWIGYDAMGTQYILRLYYALKMAGMADRATHLLQKIEQIALWNKKMVIGAWPHPPGTYANDYSTYYKFTTTNALYLNPGADGDLNSVLPYSWDSRFYNANYSLSWCDLYAFMYRETSDEQWLTMARTVFKDRYMYSMASSNVQSPRKPFWQPFGLNPHPGSGSWKVGMAITKPLLYLQTEQWLSVGWKPDIPKITSMKISNFQN